MGASVEHDLACQAIIVFPDGEVAIDETKCTCQPDPYNKVVEDSMDPFLSEEKHRKMSDYPQRPFSW